MKVKVWIIREEPENSRNYSIVVEGYLYYKRFFIMSDGVDWVTHLINDILTKGCSIKYEKEIKFQ